jgi:hypothetical protein
MEVLMALLMLGLLALCAVRWGVDSRPTDADRATSWWPANPRD